MIFTRLPDWDRRLARVTERHLASPFIWGRADCLLTVADAIVAVTGEDPFAEFRSRYTSELGAARIMKRHGWVSVADMLALHFPETGRLMARRGDVGVIERDGRVVAGYVSEHGFAAKGEDKLAFHPLTALKTAYRVG